MNVHIIVKLVYRITGRQLRQSEIQLSQCFDDADEEPDERLNVGEEINAAS